MNKILVSSNRFAADAPSSGTQTLRFLEEKTKWELFPFPANPPGIRVTPMHKEHSPHTVVHILILLYCSRLVALENTYKNTSSKRLKSEKQPKKECFAAL